MVMVLALFSEKRKKENKKGKKEGYYYYNGNDDYQRFVSFRFVSLCIHSFHSRYLTIIKAQVVREENQPNVALNNNNNNTNNNDKVNASPYFQCHLLDTRR